MPKSSKAERSAALRPSVKGPSCARQQMRHACRCCTVLTLRELASRPSPSGAHALQWPLILQAGKANKLSVCMMHTEAGAVHAGMVKYGFPLASSMAMLAWGMLEFPQVQLCFSFAAVSIQGAAVAAAVGVSSSSDCKAPKGLPESVSTALSSPALLQSRAAALRADGATAGLIASLTERKRTCCPLQAPA